MRKRIILGMGIGVLLLVLPSPLAFGETIHGCYAKNNGQLRVLTPGQACNPSEIPIEWNAQGEKGDPGPAGDPAAAVRAHRAVPVSLSTMESCDQNDKVQNCETFQRLGITMPDPGWSIHALTWTTSQGDTYGELEMQRPDPLCAANAVGVLFSAPEGTAHFCLSREAPLYNLKSDESADTDLRHTRQLVASYVPDWLILFDLQVDAIRTIEAISPAVVIGWVEPGYGELELTARVTNVGKIDAAYVVTVTGSADVLLPEAKEIRILPTQTRQLSFPIRMRDVATWPRTYLLVLSVLSPSGKRYDNVDVIFDWLGPEPPPAP